MVIWKLILFKLLFCYYFENPFGTLGMDLLTEHIKARMKMPLPGRDAQMKMASLRRLESPLSAPGARVASVLIMLHKDHPEEEWKTVLIQRASNPKDRHSGQVSFPGGSWEPADGTLEAVALREAHEEVGVSPVQVQLLGRLTDLYIPVSNFIVHPFVGYVTGKPVFSPQFGEVDHILTPPLRLFFDEQNQKITDLSVANGMVIRDVPYFDVDGRMVWGATAMIMSEFKEMIDSSLLY